MGRDHADATHTSDAVRRAAVPDYWIIDTDERAVEWARSDDSPVERLTDALLWQPDRDAPPLAIDLPRYFGRLLGEAVA